MKLDFAFVLSMCSSYFSKVTSSCGNMKSVNVASMNDVIVEEFKTWDHPLFSAGVCLAECWDDPHCVSVQVEEGGGRCVGYMVSLEVEGTFQQTPAYGVKTYLTARADGNYGSSCSQVAQCLLSNAECHDGYCGCELGFAFYPGQNTCGRNCSSLGSGLAIYFGPFAMGVVLTQQSGITLDECKVACLQNPDCVAFDFKISTMTCYLAHSRYLDVVESKRRVDDDHYYGMRHCE